MSSKDLFYYVIVVLFIKLPSLGSSLELHEVLILVLNQQDDFNSRVAVDLEDSIYKQTEELNEAPPNVIMADKFYDVSYWTILPLLKRLSEEKAEKEWVVFCPGDSKVNVATLMKTLQQFNSSTEIYLGHALKDKTPTILHHFSSSQLLYPYLPAGIAVSRALIQRASGLLRLRTAGDSFSIDVGYEFAKFFDRSERGTKMTHADAFCTECHDDCAVCPQPLRICGNPISADDLFIGVKTFQGYHTDRIPVVKKTWAPYAKNVFFYSDLEDPSIPTKYTGVPNTLQGHCQKTMSILEDLQRFASGKMSSWFAVVDDDTILSVGRLRQFLSCYDASEPLVIGERYGYLVSDPHGYAYPTGGAGIVLSEAALKILVSGRCRCPSPSAPDDMHIGTCLHRFSIPIVHSPLFHQARPEDYALPSTPSRPPISFHKHFLVDPLEVYAEHFEKIDKRLAAIDLTLKNNVKPDRRHVEL